MQIIIKFFLLKSKKMKLQFFYKPCIFATESTSSKKAITGKKLNKMKIAKNVDFI